jgi:deoxyribose-phosphate aldolase
MLNIQSSADVAKVIDHSILKPNFTETEVSASIDTAIKFNTASICVMPCYLPLVASRVYGTTVLACSVAGFPCGYGSLVEKIFEVRTLIYGGAKEVDYVINISNVKSGKWVDVEQEIQSIIYECQSRNTKIKIIIETCYLDTSEKIRLTEICSTHKADWIKTSTGFGSAGATLSDVDLLVKHAGSDMQVKAAGGIKSLTTLLAYVNAGATRCGCTSTEFVIEEAKRFYGV